MLRKSGHFRSAAAGRPPASMWIKVCGIRDVPTAVRVAQLGPDALGLNFYRGTRRCVPVDVAAEIVRELPSNVEAVGVFVNHTLAEIQDTCEWCGLKTVQLHGDETPELLAELHAARPDLKILRAYRVGADGLAPLGSWLERSVSLGAPPDACLLDARVEGMYGGSGQIIPQDLLGAWPPDWPPLILAGGLTPENVGRAIDQVRPAGVDVASGVEAPDGSKDLTRVQSFIAAAHGRG